MICICFARAEEKLPLCVYCAVYDDHTFFFSQNKRCIYAMRECEQKIRQEPYVEAEKRGRIRRRKENLQLAACTAPLCEGMNANRQIFDRTNRWTYRICKWVRQHFMPHTSTWCFYRSLRVVSILLRASSHSTSDLFRRLTDLSTNKSSLNAMRWFIFISKCAHLCNSTGQRR